MILTGKEIQKRLGKEIIIEPFDPANLSPNSYDLRLHEKLLVYTEPVLDMKAVNPTKEVIIPEEGLLLRTGELYLGRTEEWTKTVDCVPMLEGRSSIGRLGLFVHVTAGFGDNGFAGFWTLEILCTKPIRIYAGVRICQIFYHTLLGEADYYRDGNHKYQSNEEVQASMLYKDFEKCQ